MRIDGRKPNEIRQVDLILNYSIYAEGSVLIKQGNTQVLCNVTVEDSVPKWIQTQKINQGWITAEYSLLPRSTNVRTPRETSGTASRSQEIRRLIGRSLRTAVDLVKLGARTLILDCDVLQADGGTRTAAITGGYVAMTIALNRLIQAGKIPPETLLEAVAAVSVGVVDNQPVIDLCYEEDSRAQVDANVVMNDRGEFIEFQGTAERKPFSRNVLDQIIDLAQTGIIELLNTQRKALSIIG